MAHARNITGLVLLSALVLASAADVRGQCSSAAFVSPGTACLNETLLLNNTSADPSATYTWDFCEGDLQNNPTALSVTQVLAASGPTGLDVAEDDEGNHYMFVTGRTSNNLVRLEFGQDPDNPEPAIVNLGNPGGALKGPAGLRLLKEGSSWYGMIYNTQTDSLVRVDFGGAITNNDPETQNVAKANASGNNSSALTVGVASGGTVAAVTNPATNKITLINFGSSITNVPDNATDVLVTGAIPGASSLRGITLIQVCGNWYGFAVAFTSRKVYRLDFGADLFSIPDAVDITGSFSGTENFQDITVHYDAGRFTGFILTSQGVLYRLDFGGDITAFPVLTSLGNPGTLASTAKMISQKHDSQWNFFSFNTGTRFLYRVDFQDNCAAAYPVAEGFDPPGNSFDSPGVYQITVRAESALTGTDHFTREVTIEDKPAPQTDFSTAGVCAGYDVEFLATSDMALTAVEWDFGDGNGASGLTTVHQYATADIFGISLTVTALNNCRNVASRTLQVFDAPDAGFILPPSLLCTNNQHVFPTTTPDVYNGNLSYQWYVGGNPVSTQRDLQYTFTTTGAKDIRLTTSIPGCADEIVKTTSAVAEGPVVDFSYTGTCEGETFIFQHQVSDPVESFLWNFGDGQVSSGANPSVVFTAHGDHPVSLTATNAIGCENVRTRTVAVRSKPVVDFSVAGPPNACSGTSTTLVNQTVNPDDGVIAEWTWQFGDGTLPVVQEQEDGVHLFAAEGQYPVILTAKTASGCAASGEKQVLVYPSPPKTFSFTPPCDDLPVVFTGPEVAGVSDTYWEIGTSYYLEPSPVHTFRSPGEYPLYLEVTGINGCIASTTGAITVPERLSPDFSVWKNCAGQAAVLTDITQGDDPVVSREWEFAGQVFDASPVSFTFPGQGEEPVTLQVTTAAGCTYDVTKTVTILPAPAAGFSAAPVSGAYPLAVVFSNTSTYATQYLWDFSGGVSSTVFEPVQTFDGPGTFAVELTAYNDQGCEARFQDIITTVAPLPDADIDMIALTANPDASAKLIVTIHNKGNTTLRDLPLDLDFSGLLSLRTVVAGTIPPASKFNYVFNTGIVNPATLRYVCASIGLEGDRSLTGNRLCREFEDRLQIFPAWPNPAHGSLNVEWIADAGKTVIVSLTDAAGRVVSTHEIASSPGLNHRDIDVSGMENGLYILRVADGITRRTQRIAVFNRQ